MPSTSIAPTTTIPSIALVPDINGLSSRFGSEVDDDGAGAHRLHRRCRNDLRRGAPWDSGGRDHGVELGDPGLECGLLGPHLLRRQLARVPALRLRAGDAEFEPVRAEALDLLAHDGPHVEAGDDGSEPAR